MMASSLTTLVACSHPIKGGSFAATKQFAPSRHAVVALVMEGEAAPCSLKQVGIVVFDGNARGYHWATDAEALEGLRTYAASLGVDGINNIRCGGAGTTGNGVCEALPMYVSRAPRHQQRHDRDPEVARRGP